ncbi:Hypothetical predicted protein, partial [Paramuricea clavata]
TNFSIVPVSESDNSQQISNSGIDVAGNIKKIKQEVVGEETGTAIQTQGLQQLASVAEQTLVDKTKTVEKAKSQAENENELSESDAGRTGSAEQTLNHVIVVANEIEQTKQVVVHEMAVTETLSESVQKCPASPEKTIADDQSSIGNGDKGGKTGSMDVDSTVHVPNKGLIPSNPDSPRHDADVSDVPQFESSAQISNSVNDVASNIAEVKQQVVVGETETAVAETIGQAHQQLTAVSKKTSVNENKTAEEATWQAGNGNGVIVSDTGHTISGSPEQISDDLIFVANEFGEIKQVLVQETATTEILTENAQQPSTSQEEMIVDDQNSLGDSNEGGETRSTDVDSTVQVPNKGLIPISTLDFPRHDENAGGRNSDELSDINQGNDDCAGKFTNNSDPGIEEGKNDLTEIHFLKELNEYLEKFDEFFDDLQTGRTGNVSNEQHTKEFVQRSGETKKGVKTESEKRGGNAELKIENEVLSNNPDIFYASGKRSEAGENVGDGLRSKTSENDERDAMQGDPNRNSSKKVDEASKKADEDRSQRINILNKQGESNKGHQSGHGRTTRSTADSKDKTSKEGRSNQ